MAQKTAKLGWFPIIAYNLTGGLLPRSDADAPVGILELIATGRKSGQSRKVSLVYIKSDSAYIVAASNGGKDKHPGWYFNVRSNPQVTVRIKDQQFKAVAEMVDAEQRKKLWEQLVEAAPMFAGYAKRTRRQIPMVFLRPVEEGGKR